MSFFSDWFNKPKRPKVEDLERDAIDNLDRFDREDFDDIDRQMRTFRIGRHELEDYAETGGHAWSDNFHLYVKASPRIKDRSRMRPQFLLNHTVAEEFERLAEYDRLRTWTQGDVVAAAMACVTTKPDLLALMDRAKQRAKEKKEEDGNAPGGGRGGLLGGPLEGEMDEYEFAEDGIAAMEDMIEAWKNLAELLPTPEIVEQMANLDAILDQARVDLGAMAAHLETGMDELEADVNAAVRAGLIPVKAHMAEAAEWNERLAAAAAGWGMEPGELQKMDFAQRMALAERLIDNPRVNALTEIIGSIQRTALDCQANKVDYLPEEVYDVTVGNDLSRLLPQELLGLANPLLKLDFYSRYTNEKLLQYQMRGEEKLAKGGIIFAMDNSLSMRGQKEVWAKAVGLATLSIAREQKRTFYGIHFSNRSQVKCFDFRKPEDITIDAVLEYAEHFFAGGTDFEAPLNKAVTILAEEFDANGSVEGDIILATDGLCKVSDAFKKRFAAEKERMGFKCYGLAIGCSRKSEPLWTLCDGQVVTITDLLSGEEVKSLFTAL